MIVDAHCHAWESWPYAPPVPDPGRAGAETLLWHMDRNGVDRAVVICAAIGANPDNAGYVTRAARHSAGRLIPFIDVDCRWDEAHHQPGAADRLRAAIARFHPRGITHYLHEDADPAWLLSDEGVAFLRLAEAEGLILSLACGPRQLATVRQAAGLVPGLPVLLHHLARVRAGDAAALAALVAAAEAPNLHVKLSGVGFGVDDPWNYPHPTMAGVIAAAYAAFGPERTLWGSDCPVTTQAVTYRQTLQLVREHCPFIPAAARPMVLGGAMARLLA